MVRRLVSAVTIQLCALPALAGAQVHPTPAPRVVAVERRGDIHIDGRIDEDAWSAATPVTSFTQVDPHEGQPASQRTEVRFLYDGVALYVGARLYDSTGAKGVAARLNRRDNAGDGSDFLEITLDTYHDHLGRAFFRVNPLGVRSEELAQGGGSADESWDPIWEAASKIESWGWSTEMRIPFSQLRFSRDSVQTWGIQIARQILRLNERSYLAFVPKREAGGPSRYGHLEGIRIAERPRGFEALPYVVERARYIKPSASGDPFNDGSRYDVRIGGDAKYHLTSNLTLDATFDPDFGQVEVDPAVVNLSAFETFFPEKRPFFVEGAGIFDFATQNCHFCMDYSGLESFYSRRIGRAPQLNGVYDGDGDYQDLPEASSIIGAGKITGRTARGYSIGLLDAVTRRETATLVFPGDRRERHEVEPLSNYFVGRVKRDLRGGDLVIGAIGTSVARSSSDSTVNARLSRHAELAGLDLDAFWKQKTYRLLASVAASNVDGHPLAILRLQRSSARYFQRPDRPRDGNGLFSSSLDSSATRLGGYGQYARLSKDAGDWIWEISDNIRSPGYEVNDVGFLRRADYQALQGNLIRLWQTPTSWYRDWAAGIGGFAQRNFQGDRTDAYGVVGFSGTFANYWNLNGFSVAFPEAFDDRATRGGPVVKRPAHLFTFFNLNTDGRKRTSFYFGPRITLPKEGENSLSLESNMRIRAAPNVTVSVGASVSKDASSQQFVDVFTDATSTAFYGKRYLFSDLDQRTVALSTRLNWTFTPSLTLELFAQPFMSSVDYYNYKEFDTPRTLRKSVFGQTRGTIAGPNASNSYTIDPDAGGPAPAFSFENPDFSFRSLRGNAVLRWEYRPGSTLFFVWTQERSGDSSLGSFDFSRERAALFREHPDNVFLMKVNYWIGR